MAKKPNSFFGWLGRQIGHVTGAVKTEVPEVPQVVYKKTTVHEATLPDRPNEKIRRTVVDEIVREPGDRGGAGQSEKRAE